MPTLKQVQGDGGFSPAFEDTYMTITGMLGQSGLLTLLGMCVVFSFIIILIICMTIMKSVIRALKLDKEEPAKTPVASAPAASAAGNDGAVIAAIAAAVHDKALNS